MLRTLQRAEGGLESKQNPSAKVVDWLAVFFGCFFPSGTLLRQVFLYGFVLVLKC